MNQQLAISKWQLAKAALIARVLVWLMANCHLLIADSAAKGVSG
jgi:hypothetical protein